jgi:hypothetical protein
MHLSLTNARPLKAIVVALTLAAILVPAATANTSANGKYGPLDPWAYAAIHRATPSASQEIVRDNGDANLARSVRAQVASRQTTQEPVGFAWGDFAIGIAATLGTLLMLASLARLGLRHRAVRQSPESTRPAAT